MLIQHLSQDRIVVEGPDLLPSNKKSIIRILHVDDDSTFLEITKQILMDMGTFEFDSACCVDEAFKKLSTEHYDVVISDYEMPQKNGLQFLTELHEQKYEIPFILFTGKGREEVAIKALNLGADGFFNKQGNPETVYGELAHGIMQLVSQNRLNEKLLTEEERFRQLFSNTPMAVAIYETINEGEDFVFKDFNSAAEKIEKTSKADVIGKRVTEVFPGVNAFGIMKVFKRVWKTGQSEYFPDAIYQDDYTVGSWRENWVIKLPNDNIAAIYNDITERRHAEKKLIESETNYRNLINGMMESIWVINLEGNFIDVNDAAVKMLGYSKEELKSLGPKGIDKNLSQDQVRNLISSMPADGHQVFETVHTTKDGTEIPVEISYSLVNYQGKKVILSIARNISDRKKAEVALQRSEIRFRQVSENAEEWIWEVDSNGLYTYSSSVAEKLLGYKPEEIVGKKHFYELFPVDEREELKKATFQVFASKNGFSGFLNQNMHKNGNAVWLSTSGVPILNEKGDLLGYRGIDINITERKKNEDALRQERGMLESVTKNIGSGLVMISKDYKILWMNNFLRQLTGASENNHCYSSFNTCTTICPDCGPKKIFEGADFDSREYCNQTEFNKDHPVWFELIATPIKDEDGNVIAALELTVNITAKKEAEKKLKENSNKIDLMNEKLRVVGNLTRHDARNKLSAVTGYAYLLKKKHGDQADIVNGLDKMEQAVKDTIKIFELARMYEQLGVEDLTYIDVKKAINDAFALFSCLNLKVVNDCQGLRVLADSFLRQLFYNFMDNTVKYGKKTTTIRVHYEKVEQDELRLIYEDDGVGISAENKSKLFFEGFSTGGSTGFGLFLIKKMMDIYGWTISEEGEPGKGAKFVISIPSSSVFGSEKNLTSNP